MTGSAPHVTLLLKLLNSRELKYTHTTLMEHHGQAGELLVKAKLVIPTGYENVVADEDELVPVRPRPGRGELGYQDASGSWVSVSQATLRLYQVNLPAVFQTLFGGVLRMGTNGPLELAPGLVWELGDARLGRRRPTEIWFARRRYRIERSRYFAEGRLRHFGQNIPAGFQEAVAQTEVLSEDR